MPQNWKWQSIAIIIVFFVFTSPVFAQNLSQKNSQQKDDSKTEDKTLSSKYKPYWKNPAIPRRPQSYIGGSIGYVQSKAWLKANDDHDNLTFGPLNSPGLSFRVGDVFKEWFCIGFQINITSAKKDDVQIAVFNLSMDTTFYPWKGLGFRPFAGIGLGFAKGAKPWETGGGGPGCLGFATMYEFRVSKGFSIAPIFSSTFIAGEEFSSLLFFAGIELTKWIDQTGSIKPAN